MRITYIYKLSGLSSVVMYALLTKISEKINRSSMKYFQPVFFHYVLEIIKYIHTNLMSFKDAEIRWILKYKWK